MQSSMPDHDIQSATTRARVVPVAQPILRVFDALRPRSHGPLTRDEIAHCRAEGIALAYDPAQTGWVTAACLDDLDDDLVAAAPRPAPAFKPRALAPTYRFRPWAEADLAVYRKLLDDPAVWAMMYERYPNPLDSDMALDLIRLSSQADHHEVRAVLRDGHVVGQVRVLFGAAPDTAELSYWLGRDWWGKGIGSDIVTIHTGQTFARHPALTSIRAVVHDGNAASRRVLEKAGFRPEGQDPRRPGWTVFRQTRTGAEAVNSGNVPA